MKNEFNFENILVPYNASPGAEKGLEAAIEFAKKSQWQYYTYYLCGK